jgi:hypothetical protein
MKRKFPANNSAPQSDRVRSLAAAQQPLFAPRRIDRLTGVPSVAGVRDRGQGSIRPRKRTPPKRGSFYRFTRCSLLHAATFAARRPLGPLLRLCLAPRIIPPLSEPGMVLMRRRKRGRTRNFETFRRRHAYSRPSLPLIPRQSCHPFPSKAATDSGESCHSLMGVEIRSD